MGLSESTGGDAVRATDGVTWLANPGNEARQVLTRVHRFCIVQSKWRELFDTDVDAPSLLATAYGTPRGSDDLSASAPGADRALPGLSRVSGELSAPAAARFGAIAFIHRFGASLNCHLHYHCCVTEGLFCAEEQGVRFYPSALCPEASAEVEQRTRRRVLRLFKRRDILPADVVEAMLQWSHAGGFSVDVSILIEARDRRGLERLLRYCARPVLALERLHWCDERHERLVYDLPKVQPDGHTTLCPSPHWS
jgi:hypothetical protein